jgi:hypothetical protein
MDIATVIYNLRQELELLHQAIHSLEPLVPKRRGRPRKETIPNLQQLGVPDSVPRNSGRRASGNRNIAASAGDLAREPGTDGGRKGANLCGLEWQRILAEGRPYGRRTGNPRRVRGGVDPFKRFGEPTNSVS